MTNANDLEGRLAALEARLESSEAHAALINLKSAYGGLADARYTRKGPKSQPEIDVIAGQLAALFTEDAIWDGGGDLGRCQGRAEIRARFTEPSLHYSWHFFVKPRFEIDRMRASGTWDVLALVTTLDRRAMWMVGVEHDEYERVDGVWLHSRMKLDAKLMAPHDRGW